MPRVKYHFKQELKNISKPVIKEYLRKEVFERPEFDLQIKRVAFNLKVDEQMVRDVVEDYFTNIMFLINSVLTIKTKINVYGFFSLIIEKGRRI